MSVSVDFIVKQMPSGDLVCESVEGCCVDFTADGNTPLREGVRANIRFDSNDAACMLFAEKFFSVFKPASIAGMPASIGEQPLP